MTEEEIQVIKFLNLSVKEKRRIRLVNADPAPF